MIEALKDLIGLLKDIPHHAMWILGGFMFYKLFIVGSVYGCIRLAINKIHDFLIRPKTTIIEYKIGEQFINEQVFDKFKLLIRDMADSLEKSNPHNQYLQRSYIRFGPARLHESDIDILRTALAEYFKMRDQETKPKEQI